jgi:hypothetical protein
MKDKQQLISELNNLLTSKTFNEELLNELLNQSAEAGLLVKLIDLTFYNEEKLLYAKKEKIFCIKSQLFDRAALMRDHERNCIKYIELREKHNVEKSIFCIEGNLLLFFYFGAGVHDEKVREVLKIED